MRKLFIAFVLGVSSLAAFAQTKPMVKDLGAELPTSAAYIGNSFFYYNNGLIGTMWSRTFALTPLVAIRSTRITTSSSTSLIVYSMRP